MIWTFKEEYWESQGNLWLHLFVLNVRLAYHSCSLRSCGLYKPVLNMFLHPSFYSDTTFMTILLPFNKTATIICYKIQDCGTNKMTEGSVCVHVQIIMRCFFFTGSYVFKAQHCIQSHQHFAFKCNSQLVTDAEINIQVCLCVWGGGEH